MRTGEYCWNLSDGLTGVVVSRGKRGRSGLSRLPFSSSLYMKSAVTSSVFGDPAAILDRHAIRRTTVIPTISLLVGPIGAGGRTWHRWAAGTGRSVVLANWSLFPTAEWVRAV